MKILLVQPAPYENGRIGLETALWMSEPAALTALAAMVEGEHEVRIVDMRVEPADVLPRVLAEYRPHVLGVTAMTTDAYQAQAVALCAKSILGDAVFTILGGHHPTLMPGDHDQPYIDAVCIGEGEETFQEVVAHLAAGRARDEMAGIAGLRIRVGQEVRTTPARSQARELDSFPAPARHLVAHYAHEYFFAAANGIASIQTSRGCAFDCNFCAIWEFYERKVRFLSARAIVDRMEAATERFIMFLDDNFLTHRQRLEELVDEIERRGVRKYWMIQGRTDFIVKNADLMQRLRDAGLMMVLSGYESNEDDTLAALQKDNSKANNLEAAHILRELGILSMGIFMVHPDWEERQFDQLYETINQMRITMPMVVIHMPLPGTQAWREHGDELLTRDARFFDLLHAVTPTRLTRRRFYEKYAEWNGATMKSTRGSLTPAFLLKRPALMLRLALGYRKLEKKSKKLRRAIGDPENFLRDEYEIVGRDLETPTPAELVA